MNIVADFCPQEESDQEMLNKLMLHFEVMNESDVFRRAYTWYHDNRTDTETPRRHFDEFKKKTYKRSLK